MGELERLALQMSDDGNCTVRVEELIGRTFWPLLTVSPPASEGPLILGLPWSYYVKRRVIPVLTSAGWIWASY